MNFPYRPLLSLFQLRQPFWLAGGVINYNSERAPPSDHSTKIEQVAPDEKFFK